MRLPYPLVCTLVGLAVAWLPMLVHGPIPEKFSYLIVRDTYQPVNGALAVWAYYLARLMTGFFVGITWFPRRWYLRGPMCGFLLMLPTTMFSLANPLCGPTCMQANLATTSLIGFTVAGLAYYLTGKHHA